VKTFEEAFEQEHGHKPSTQEKNNKLEIKKALLELSKLRKELKRKHLMPKMSDTRTL